MRARVNSSFTTISKKVGKKGTGRYYKNQSSQYCNGNSSPNLSAIRSKKGSLPSLQLNSSGNNLFDISKLSSEDKVQYLKNKIKAIGFGKQEVGDQPKLIISNKVTKMSTPLINIMRRNHDSESGYSNNLSR